MLAIDLNADLGEGEPGDADMFRVVSSCNIACGGHTGNVNSMRAAVKDAIKNDVVIGAHPSYPDKEGFGRRAHFLEGNALLRSLVAQIENLQKIATSAGAAIAHVKPHGALYNDAAENDDLAIVVASATAKAAPGAMLVGPPKSALQTAAAGAGLDYAAEAFVDRAYLDDRRLVPRSETGAVHEKIAVMAAQAVSLATGNTVTTTSDKTIEIAAQTLCIHGDTPGAVDAASAVREALENAGVEIRAIGRR